MKSTGTDTKILDAALRLMLSKGYPATTVDEICTEAGVSKGSFYHFFKKKEDVGLATLAHFYRRGQAEMRDGAFVGITDPLERALAFVDHIEAKSKYLWTDGCLLGSFATELTDTNPAMREEVSRLFNELAAVMAAMFRPVEERVGAGGPTAKELADMFLTVLEGSILLARAHKDPERIPAAVRQFRGYLESLVG
jgi:TetR/AcrR family transcriptional repressor of nem operon